jgi:hypothetical protein
MDLYGTGLELEMICCEYVSRLRVSGIASLVERVSRSLMHGVSYLMK